LPLQKMQRYLLAVDEQRRAAVAAMAGMLPSRSLSIPHTESRTQRSAQSAKIRQVID
jgi:hypothetical protein